MKDEEEEEFNHVPSPSSTSSSSSSSSPSTKLNDPDIKIDPTFIPPNTPLVGSRTKPKIDPLTFERGEYDLPSIIFSSDYLDGMSMIKLWLMSKYNEGAFILKQDIKDAYCSLKREHIRKHMGGEISKCGNFLQQLLFNDDIFPVMYFSTPGEENEPPQLTKAKVTRGLKNPLFDFDLILILSRFLN